jgi:hypothetical protein
MTKVVNKYKSEYDVYIGRGSIFGNPFVIGKDGTRDEVILKYRNYFYDKIIKDEDFLKAVLLLKDKVLGCFCKPQDCHGDIIVGFLDEIWTKYDLMNAEIMAQKLMELFDD